MAFPPRPPRGAFNPRFKKEQQQEHRTNHMIRVPQVRLVGENIEVGVYPTAEAQRIANDQGLTLLKFLRRPIRLFVKSLITINFFTKKRRRKKK